MYDRAILRHDILNILNKSPATPGFYTPDKCNMAIQKALDLAATEMIIYDQGFVKKLDFIDVAANQLTIPVPPHMEFIEKVSYLVGNIYTPLQYDSRWDSADWSQNSGATSLPFTYQLVDNSFYFNPPIGVGGEKFLQVVYQRFPSIMRSDSQQLDPQFSRATINWVIYNAATQLSSMYGMGDQSGVPWASQEAMWYDKMMMLITKRNASSQPIRDFAGY